MSPELQAALVGLVIVLTTFLQSLYQRWKAEQDKAELKDKADEVKSDTRATVNAALNGEGLGGMMVSLKAWTEAHERKDDERFAAILDELRRGKPDCTPKR